MYLDFEDYRPETPRVQPVISAREGVLLSIIAHLVLLVCIILAPQRWFQASATEVPVQPQEPMQYVQMLPTIDRSELAKKLAEQSDQDRRSMTRERAPQPENPAPYSRGDTPEKVQGAPEVRTAGPETQQPPAPEPPKPSNPQASMGLLPEVPSPPSPAASSGNLGRDLRNPERYVQNQNFENFHGGDTDQGTDIQFDSKGIDFGPWLRRFTAQVRRNWFIPQVAEMAHGDVILQFFVLRNGTITDLHVVKPATIEALTLSAMNAIKLSNPAPTLPPDYPDDRIQFTVHFYYNETIRETP